MNVDRRQLLWLAVATLVLAALVYVSDWREFVAATLRADPRYVALAIGCGFFTLAMWSVVWYRFFDVFDIEAGPLRSAQLLLAGTFLNAVTPLGRFGGEPFVAHLVARNTGANHQEALSSVSSSDISNALPFVSFGAAATAYLALFGTLQGTVADAAWVVVVLFVASLVLVYLLWFGGLGSVAETVDEYVSYDPGFGRFDRYVHWVRARAREFLDEMREVGRRPRNAAVTLLVSHLAVAGHVGATYFVLLAVGVEPNLPATFLVVTLSAVLTVSPTPGSTGTFEAGFAALVALFFPVTVATATSVAILYRIGTYLPGVLLGYASVLSLRTPDPSEG